MKYESEFRIKEKEFYPREDYSHKKVIDELANIVKEADLEIEDLVEALDNEVELNDKFYKESVKNERMALYMTVIGVCSLIINVLQTL